MKKYLIIATYVDNKVNASLHLKEQTNQTERMIFDLTISNATLLGMGNLQRDTIYYFESDVFDAEFERVMRTLGFRKCDNCNNWIAPQEINTSVYEGNGIRYCAKCYAEINKNTQPVCTYHQSKQYIKLLKTDEERELTLENIGTSNVLTCGIEMEAEDPEKSFLRSGKIKTTEEFYKENTKGRAKYRLFRLETDGSLPRGVEFISNVMTKKFTENFDWNILTNQMKFLGAVDSNPNTGFHIHIGKQALGADAYEQALNCLKLTYFMSIYQSDFVRLSGREINYMRYCSFPTEEKIMQIKNGILQARQNQSDPFNYHTYAISHGSSGCAFISSNTTVEVRIFKSTSDAERIKHTLALILNLAENIKNVPWKKLYCLSKTLKAVPEETLKYWRNKGCFLHTYAVVKKGENLELA